MVKSLLIISQALVQFAFLKGLSYGRFLSIKASLRLQCLSKNLLPPSGKDSPLIVQLRPIEVNVAHTSLS